MIYLNGTRPFYPESQVDFAITGVLFVVNNKLMNIMVIIYLVSIYHSDTWHSGKWILIQLFERPIAKRNEWIRGLPRSPKLCLLLEALFMNIVIFYI